MVMVRPGDLCRNLLGEGKEMVRGDWTEFWGVEFPSA